MTRRRYSTNPLLSPVGRAIAMGTVRCRVTELGIHIHTLRDGEPCAPLLAELAWLVGLGTEVALAAEGPGSTRLRRLHGALRGIVQLCLEGYRWREHLRLAVDQAVADANRLIWAHERLAVDAMPGAAYIESRILTRTVCADDVAGAEIYTTTEAHAT